MCFSLFMGKALNTSIELTMVYLVTDTVKECTL